MAKKVEPARTSSTSRKATASAGNMKLTSVELPDAEVFRDSDCLHVTGFRMGETDEEDVIMVQWNTMEGVTQPMLFSRAHAHDIGAVFMAQSATGTKQ